MLTKREQDVLSFIKAFMVQNGYTPTIRDIADGVHLQSTSSAHRHFELLVAKGEITMHGKGYSVRGMKYVEEDQSNR